MTQSMPPTLDVSAANSGFSGTSFLSFRLPLACGSNLARSQRRFLRVEQYAGRMNHHDAQGWPQLTAEQIYCILDAYVLAWPKVDLPNSWGSDSPKEETAYRFLNDVIYQIGRGDPTTSIAVFDRFLSDARFANFHNAARSKKAEAVRQLALSGFQTPRPAEISRLLDKSKVASVEDMRALLIELLDELQRRLKGAATNPVDVFYSGDDQSGRKHGAKSDRRNA